MKRNKTYQVELVGVAGVCLRHEDNLLLRVCIGETQEGLVGDHDSSGCLVLELELHDQLLLVVSCKRVRGLLWVSQPADKGKATLTQFLLLRIIKTGNYLWQCI